MREQLFRISPDSSISLQSRIREMLVSAILDGHILPGSALPSGRHLAQQLDVARNTVVLVYQQLVDEGYLIARERSGYYVSEDILAGLHRAIILRAISIISRSGGVTDQFTFTGGVAKNEAAVRELKKLVFENYGEVKINIDPDSIYTGALGGAEFARRAAQGRIEGVDA